MFNIPLREITFQQVEEFCRTFEEDVRVEYKREPAQIPKIISSFANTVGGIWVIGVETDEGNRPRFPIEGMERRRGVEEQIVQSAQTGIYPSLTPDVRVLDVPGRDDRIVVIVKVSESIEAPHAIENSTKVYVRKASTTATVDLADIDRIEYLLKRRQQPEQRREELTTRAASRSPFRQTEPRVRVVIAALYPRGLAIAPHTLYERAWGTERMGHAQYLTSFRRVQGGIMSSRLIVPRITHHLEIDARGIVFFERPFEAEGSIRGFETRDEIRYVRPIGLLHPVATMLSHVVPLFQGTLTNLLVRYELFGLTGIGFVPEFGHRTLDRDIIVERNRCVDSHIAASAHAVLETLGERRVEILSDIMGQILWAFDYAEPDLPNLVGETLRNAHLA